MTPQELENLLERYGADLVGWPDELGVAAQALLEESPEARAVLRDAEALSSVLDAAPRGEVHSALTARILASAPGEAHKIQGDLLGHIVGVLWPDFGWVRPAALMALSMMAGLYLGIAAPSATTMDEDTDLFAYVFEVPDAWETGEMQ